MTNPSDLTGIMPMQWVFDVDLTQANTSQRLNVKHGKRIVDGEAEVIVEPGVYMFSWDTNMPGTEWKSFYFRDYSDSDVTFTNFGSRTLSGRQRVVIPKKSNLRCYTALDTQIDTVEPVVAVTMIPVAPLANVFES